MKIKLIITNGSVVRNMSPSVEANVLSMTGWTALGRVVTLDSVSPTWLTPLAAVAFVGRPVRSRVASRWVTTVLKTVMLTALFMEWKNAALSAVILILCGPMEPRIVTTSIRTMPLTLTFSSSTQTVNR